jgi:hypothetical protein
MPPPDSERRPPAAATATVKQLAGQAKMPVADALELLKANGFPVKHKDDKLTGALMRDAREALGLRAWGDKPPPAAQLTPDELVVRMLRPMLRMGKCGPEHHTRLNNVWHNGVPPNQRGEARELAEAMIASEELGNKMSDGNLHVWLTNAGRRRLQLATEAMKRAGGDPDGQWGEDGEASPPH